MRLRLRSELVRSIQKYLRVELPAAYMSNAIPLASDFSSNAYAEFLKRICHRYQVHRKLWEWAFIVHHLEQEGKLVSGMRGLGFGVGAERLPSLFAASGCTIVATDSPPEIGKHWSAVEYSRGKSELWFPDIVEERMFNRHVEFRVCDMNHLERDLTDFDFCWSACALEHLGDIESGMEFVRHSMNTVKPGGVAVHTTEYNLSSNDDTVLRGQTVLYRRRDIERLHRVLEESGYVVCPLPIRTGNAPLDSHIDVPPYTHDPHLKIRLMNYITTSIGIVIRRPR